MSGTGGSGGGGGSGPGPSQRTSEWGPLANQQFAGSYGTGRNSSSQQLDPHQQQQMPAPQMVTVSRQELSDMMRSMLQELSVANNGASGRGIKTGDTVRGDRGREHRRLVHVADLAHGITPAHVPTHSRENAHDHVIKRIVTV
jgi:hypothetical protein